MLREDDELASSEDVSQPVEAATFPGSGETNTAAISDEETSPTGEEDPGETPEDADDNQQGDER
jgi:hypothetical protein